MKRTLIFMFLILSVSLCHGQAVTLATAEETVANDRPCAEADAAACRDYEKCVLRGGEAAPTCTPKTCEEMGMVTCKEEEFCDQEAAPVSGRDGQSLPGCCAGKCVDLTVEMEGCTLSYKVLKPDSSEFITKGYEDTTLDGKPLAGSCAASCEVAFNNAVKREVKGDNYAVGICRNQAQGGLKKFNSLK